MSEKEKAMCAKIAQLPPELQNRLADKLDGAVMALELMEEKKGGEADDENVSDAG